MSSYTQLTSRLARLRHDLTTHDVYDRLSSIQSLHVLMQEHVFAVWDFMSLLKALQKQLTCVEIPWRPSGTPTSARLLNEIVLAEESDLGPDGEPMSHFELYVTAMKHAGADTGSIESFLQKVEAGEGIRQALRSTTIQPSTRHFVTTTFDIIDSEDVCQIASAFTFGREELLPDVFQELVFHLNTSTGGELDAFEFYLARHIELDGDEHGAMARQVIESICGDDPQKWRAAESAAVRCLRARKMMWDSIADEIDAVNGQ